jgi:hypothetical protein
MCKDPHQVTGTAGTEQNRKIMRKGPRCSQVVRVSTARPSRRKNNRNIVQNSTHCRLLLLLRLQHTLNDLLSHTQRGTIAFAIEMIIDKVFLTSRRLDLNDKREGDKSKRTKLRFYLVAARYVLSRARSTFCLRGPTSLAQSRSILKVDLVVEGRK